MKQKIKVFIQYIVIVIFVGLGVFAGNFITGHFKNMGVNYVTFGDVIGTYIASIVIIGLIGIFIGAIWLEEIL